MDIILDEIDSEKYFWALYYLECKTTLLDGAMELAIGQSIGNPNARSTWETKEMIEDHCAKIYSGSPGFEKNQHQKDGVVWIGFPYANIDWDTDGVSQLMCMLMGGQMDIDNIVQCHLLEIDIDKGKTNFLGPRYGIEGIRQRTGAYNRPLFGGIIKPKTGITPVQLLDMTKALVDGGVDFIKEDEILGNPAICPFAERVPLISDWLEKYAPRVIYTFCINSDGVEPIIRAHDVHRDGGPGVHLNFWSGLGMYKALRDENLDLFIHYQKSGDKILTSVRNAYRIDWNVLCELAGLCGVDFIHAGMYGGYLSDTEEDLRATFETLHRHGVMPALSCGMNADLIAPIAEKFGNDWMANVGGAIHSDPAGTIAGARKIRQAIDAL